MSNIQDSRKSVRLGWMICILGAIFFCYEYLLRIEPSVMVTELMRDFSLTAAEFGLITSLYYFAYTPMQIGVGVLTDIFGPRKMLTFAVSICAIGSLIFGASDNIWVLGFGRFLIGFGSSFAFVGVLKLAAIWLPSSRFALFVGLATSLGMVGAMVGDVQLSVLVHRIGWQDTIFVGTIFGFLLIPFIWFIVRDTHGDPSVMEPLERVTVREAFRGVWQMARNQQMWLIGLIGLALYMSLTVFAELWGIDFLRKFYGLSSADASRANAMVFFGWLLGGPFAGWFSDYIRSRRLVLFIGCLLSGICILIILYFPPSNLTVLFALLLGYGFFSSAEIVCFAMGRENCSFHMAGSAVAFVNTLVMFGGMIFQSQVGKILDWGWTGKIVDGVRVYPTEAYQNALVMIPIALAISMVLIFLVRESFGSGEEA